MHNTHKYHVSACISMYLTCIRVYRVCIDHQYVLAPYWHRIGDVLATCWRRIGTYSHTYQVRARNTPYTPCITMYYLVLLSIRNVLSCACSYYASIRCPCPEDPSRSEEADEDEQGGRCHHHMHARAQAVLPPSSIPRAPGSPQLRLARIPCSRSPSADVGPADAKSTGG